MATIKDLAEQYGVAKAQDQNENLGKLAEMLGSARDIGNEYKVPSWVPLAGGTGAGDLLMGKTPEEIENWSYGNAPMQIPEMSNVPQFKRGRAQSLADALTTLAPGVKATEDLPVGLAIKAYHGSPHLFDRFDMSKIGTGEGAQAYGHGLYFAENPMVADDYLREFKSNKNQDATIYETNLTWPDKNKEQLDPLNKKHFLDYKKDFSKQSKYVQDAIENAANKRNEDPLYKGPFISGHVRKTGEDLLNLYGEDDLLQEGIPGVRYLDEGSRGLGKKTHNLVLFSDEYPEITKRAGSLDELQEKNLNKQLIEKYLSEGKLSPDDMAQYEQNALAMETPLLQRYNVANADSQGGTFLNRAKDRGYDPEDIYTTNSVDEWLPSIKKKEDVGNYGGMFDGIFLLNGSEGGSRGYDFDHQFIANPNKIANTRDKDLDFNKTMSFLKKEYGHELNDDELSRLYDLTAYDDDIWDGGENVLSKLNDEYNDLGRASWEAQNIRGKLAKDQGFDLIKMRDEEGTSYFAPHGSKIKSTLAAFDPLRKNSSSIMASGLLGGLGLKYANDEDQGYAQGGIVDKLKSQDFGPNDSVIVSSLMHPQEAAGKAGDWLQEKMRIASGRPYEDNFTPDQQAQAGLDLAGLMQTGAMPFAPASAGGTLGTFIGPKSRNWDKVAAELAAKKLDEGADPAEVWREHLIGRMPDKTLFSEIDDSKFRLNNSNDYDAMIVDKRKAMAENIAQQKEFESLKNAESPQLDLYPKEFKKAINEKINNLRNDRNYIRDELSGDLGLEHGLGSFEGQRVRNAFQHSDLINAYPELTNDSIIKQNRMLESGVRGQLSGTNIDLSNNLLDYPDEAASTALHEFQHAIQNHEGWGKGSNPLTSQSDYYNFLGKKFKDIDGSNILSKFNELSGKSEPYYRIKQIQDLQNISQPRQLFNSSDYYKHSTDLRDLLGAPPKYGSKLPWAQDAGNIIANKIKDELTWNGKDLLESIGNDRDFAKKMIRSIEGKKNRIGYDKYSDAYKTSQEMQRTDPRFKDLPNEEKMKLYQRSAGEAQARATQDRLNMDIAQRRENYPLAGGKLSDIPLEDLIY